jgi:hypothetical protein
MNLFNDIYVFYLCILIIIVLIYLYVNKNNKLERYYYQNSKYKYYILKYFKFIVFISFFMYLRRIIFILLNSAFKIKWMNMK